MRILALDSAVARCSATLVVDGVQVAARQRDLERDHAAVLPVFLQECLQAAGVKPRDLDAIGVTVGPGSFTGIRAGLALALGLGLAAGCPVIGVTVGEALAASLPALGRRQLWCAIPSRRGRVFLDTGKDILSCALTELPAAAGPIAVAGNAAAEVASRLAARGADVMLTDARLPTGRLIGLIAERRLRGELPALPAEPLYIDPPEAKPNLPVPPAPG